MLYNLLVATLSHSIGLQEKCTLDWHTIEPSADTFDARGLFSEKACSTLSEDEIQLASLVLTQHLQNFRLWHIEDIARKKDVDATVIADCKYKIDILNQKRNDYMEKVDVFCTQSLLPLCDENTVERYNSETIGMIIDRLSILALKVYHMNEEAQRTTATQEHRDRCAEKLASLQTQRSFLATALFDLLEDYRLGVKRPFVYRQHKMYNDPSLNPQLYNK